MYRSHIVEEAEPDVRSFIRFRTAESIRTVLPGFDRYIYPAVNPTVKVRVRVRVPEDVEEDVRDTLRNIVDALSCDCDLLEVKKMEGCEEYIFQCAISYSYGLHEVYINKAVEYRFPISYKPENLKKLLKILTLFHIYATQMESRVEWNGSISFGEEALITGKRVLDGGTYLMDVLRIFLEKVNIEDLEETGERLYARLEDMYNSVMRMLEWRYGVSREMVKTCYGDDLKPDKDFIMMKVKYLKEREKELKGGGGGET